VRAVETEDLAVVLERMKKMAERLQMELAREGGRDRVRKVKVELDTIAAAIDDLQRRVSAEAERHR
jgi:hypothetical protein